MSARAQVDTGGNIMIAGFVISGETAQTVLICAVGQHWATTGSTGVLADPELKTFKSESVQIDANDDWSSGLAGTFAQVERSRLMPPQRTRRCW